MRPRLAHFFKKQLQEIKGRKLLDICMYLRGTVYGLYFALGGYIDVQLHRIEHCLNSQ